MKANMKNADSRIREALHAVFAELLDEIETSMGAVLVVEDLHVDTYAVSVSVMLKPSEKPVYGDPEGAGE